MVYAVYTPIVMYMYIPPVVLFIISMATVARYGVYSECMTLDLSVFGPDGLAALSILLAVTREKRS